MKVVVFGAGGVGAFFGGLLARAGVDVHFVARGAQLDALRNRGLQIRSTRLGTIDVAPVKADEDTQRIGEVDLVLVCVKTYQTGEILEALVPLVGERTRIVTLQNGVESDLVLADRFGAERVVPGVVYVGATLEEPGVVSHVAAGTISIGVRAGGDGASLPAIAAVLGRTGLPVRIAEDIQQERWTKLLWNAGFNPVSALTGKPPRDLLTIPSTRALVEHVMSEVFAVAHAEGFDLGDTAIARQVEWTANAPPLQTSMMVDRERGRTLEIDALMGVVVRTAGRHGVATPYCEALLGLLEGLTAERGDHPSVP